MSILRNIRAVGAFRSPQFADLGHEHVQFDDLTRNETVEAPLLETVKAGGSAVVLGGRGAGKSSVLAWLCQSLPDDHIPIRVPVVGMDDPASPTVFASVTLAAALEAADAGAVALEGHQRDAIHAGRADETTTRTSRTRRGAKAGGGLVPVEVSTQLASLETEHRRASMPIDRLYGLDRLVRIFSFVGLVPVFVIEDTEAALGADASQAQRDRFFSASLRLLVREIDAPSLIAVQTSYSSLDAYSALRPHLREVSIPRLDDEVTAGLSKIVAHRLRYFEIETSVEQLIATEAMPYLAAFYDENAGSIRHVLQALDSAAAAALDSGASRLELGHVKQGIEDWRDR